MTLEELEWLQAEGLDRLSTLRSAPAADALALATRLRKELPASQARLLQEQLELQDRAVSKFGTLA